jgi:hypothetical protein
MSSISSLFNRPLLIYDDKCYSCTKFAKVVGILSRGWVRIAGHYYSQDAKQAKNVIFPPGYDSTKMFWLVNKNGAYGARSGLPHVIKEIAFGLVAGPNTQSYHEGAVACEYTNEKTSCFTSTNILKRIAKLLSHGATFRF